VVVSGTPTTTVAASSSASTQQRLISFCWSLAGGQLSGRNGWSQQTIHRATRRHLQQERGFRSAHSSPSQRCIVLGAARAGSCDTFKWIAAGGPFLFLCLRRARCLRRDKTLPVHPTIAASSSSSSAQNAEFVRCFLFPMTHTHTHSCARISRHGLRSHNHSNVCQVFCTSISYQILMYINNGIFSRQRNESACTFF
jgi:hypothetical protein